MTLKIAKAGEVVSPKAAAKLRKRHRFFEHVLSTKEGCTIYPDSKQSGGQWVCVDCGEIFMNNLGAQGHAKSHRRAWWTGERFEEP